MDELTGKCLCGSVAYRVTGEFYGVVSCHCKECQRLHGNYNPMIVVDKEDFVFANEKSVAWYDSSEEKDRGFCIVCGAALFMRQKQGPKILISVGSLDDTSALVNVKNIWTEDAAPYYTVSPEHS